MSDWESVIGLEVHCQLATRSKLTEIGRSEGASAGSEVAQ